MLLRFKKCWMNLQFGSSIRTRKWTFSLLTSLDLPLRLLQVKQIFILLRDHRYQMHHHQCHEIKHHFGFPVISFLHFGIIRNHSNTKQNYSELITSSKKARTSKCNYPKSSSSLFFQFFIF